ncbi:MAG: hypothetical protein KC457_31440, partial [Myxococcales bacterium]|nr:hypothetical protein [Myxococcales bacterium]
RLDDAAGRYDRAQEFQARFESVDTDTRIYLLSGQGRLALLQGRLDEAERLLKQCDELVEREEPARATVARLAFVHAQVAWAREDRDAARASAREARETYVEAGRFHAGRLAEVDAWLAEHE